MNNNDSILYLEMFGSSPEVGVTPLPELSIDGLDEDIRRIDEQETHTWAGGPAIRQTVLRDLLDAMIGETSPPEVKTVAITDEFIKVFTGDTVAISDVTIPDEITITTAKPTSKPKASRRKKIRDMVQELVDNLEAAGYHQTDDAKEAVAKLEMAMLKYVNNSVANSA